MKSNLPARAELNLESQIRVANRLQQLDAARPARTAPFVTLSRQFGCEAVALAEQLVKRLDAEEQLETGSWQVYGRKLIEAMADQQYSYDQLMTALDTKTRGAIEEFVESLVGQISDLKLLHKLVQTIRATATLGRCVIIGRGGAIITRDLPGGIHVRLVAAEEFRLQGLVERHGWSAAKAREELHVQDTSRRSFYKKYLNRDANDPVLYDLVLNAGQLTQEQQVEQILSLYRSRMLALAAR